MNRFAALDSDNEEENKPNVPADKKKKDKETAVIAPSTTTTKADTSAQATKKAPDSKPKGEAKRDNKDGGKPNNSKPHGQRNDKPRQPRPDSSESLAPSGAEGGGGGSGDFAEFSGSVKGEKRDQRNFGKAPRTRFEKRQDENDPHIKPDNRIRGVAHGINRRRGPRNAEREEADGLAKEGEKNPHATEPVTEPVENAEAVDEVAEPVPETAEEPQPPAEPEKVTLSFDEYQRLREEARANSALLAQEKAARSVEQLTGLKEKENDAGPEVYTGTVKSSKTTKASQRATSKTVVLDLGFNVDAEQETRAPREDRRPQGGRGGGGRGGRGQRPGRGARIDVADVNLFPSL